jgi:hypothetical protein
MVQTTINDSSCLREFPTDSRRARTAGVRRNEVSAVCGRVARRCGGGNFCNHRQSGSCEHIPARSLACELSTIRRTHTIPALDYRRRRDGVVSPLFMSSREKADLLLLALLILIAPARCDQQAAGEF